MLQYWDQMILAITAEEMDTHQTTLEEVIHMDKVMVIDRQHPNQCSNEGF